MMKAFVMVIVVVYFAQEINAKPHDSLDLLIRDLHRRHGDCEALAGHLDKYMNWMLNNVMDHRSPAFVRDAVERATGINFFDPNEMRRVVCRMTETSALSELKAALNELGIALHGLTWIYNYAVASMPFNIAGLEAAKEWSHEDTYDVIDAGINVLNMLQESHLSGLDPEGTQWVTDNILLGGPAGGPGRRSSLSRGAFFRRSGEDEFCENLLTAINNLMTAAFEEGHYTEENVLPYFEALWGFDPFDEDQLRSILCEIAGVTSIEEGIEVLDNRGTLDHIFSFLYYEKVIILAYEKDYLESVLEEEDQGYNSGWQQEKAAVYLPVIYGLEETGLLSLENDLVEQ